MKTPNTKALFTGILICLCASATHAQTLFTQATNSTSCGIANGALSASIDGDMSGYSFSWYSGADTSGEIFASTPVVSFVPPGVYTVQVTDDLTSEVYGPQSVMVLDETVFPEFSIEIIASNSSCSVVTPNGSMAVILAGGADPADYSYAWYAGVGLDTPLAGESNDTIQNLTEGNYTVVVTNAASQCSSMNTTTINQETVSPVVNLTATDVTSCVSPNGSITAEIDGGSISDYTFEWYADSDSTDSPLDDNDNILDSIAEGTFTVKVVSLLTTCETVTSDSVGKLWPSFPPVEKTDVTSCSGNNGNLAIVAPEGTEGDYTYAWFTSAGAFSDTLSTEMSISGLSPGTYFSMVTHIATGCNNVLIPFVADSSSALSASVNVISDQTQCSVSNGSLSAVVNGSPSDYTFAWFLGTEISVDTLSTSQSVDGLAAGQYSVSVTENVSGCSTFITAAVPDSISVVTVDIETTSQTSCVPPNGSAAAIMNPAAAYTYVWFEGNDLSGDTLSIASSITQLAAGIFSVVVTDTTSGCYTVATAFISDNSAIVANMITTPQSSCVLPNGSATAEVDGNAGNYLYAWYASGTFENTLGTTQTISGLPSGLYTVMITDTTTGCEQMMTSGIEEQLVYPVASVSTVSHVTFCDSPNGSVTADVDDIESFSYKWFEGNEVTSSVLGTGQTLHGLSPGAYTVQITDDITGCMAVASTSIYDIRRAPDIIVEILSHETSCGSPNGVVAVRPALLDTVRYYSYDWYQGPSVADSVIAENDTVSYLTHGLYTVLVTDTITACTNTATVEINLNTIIPGVTVAVVSPVTSCTTPNGSIQILTDVAFPEYTIQWFEGPAVSTNVIGTAPELTGLSAGVYTVRVEDADSECAEILSVALEDARVMPVAAITINEDVLSSEAVEGHQYKWLLNNELLDETTNEITATQSGEYALVVISELGCASDTAVVVIDNRIVTALERQQTFQHGYPNPTKNIFWVKSDADINSEVVVTDPKGSVILKTKSSLKMNEGFAIDLSAQPEGVYFVKYGKKYFRVVKN
jgi:large repetitive protein